ncbi:hypothetical protein FAM09_29500 [Niastella caeni]|uniref:Uncharacterized protein n=1 Tax=Niastella caeni TaxID=2569763 RepID=A0A4S8H7C4_9BACT|nr:hypothetical protein [Niastella caeni]THU30738.1 hypothetical protein FAM09_29500 [Niastella caeni]
MKTILLLILSTYCFCGYSQSTSRDTAWYVELKDSTILYSKKLSVRNSLLEGEYILLDNNKKILMSQVIRYRSRAGEFIRDRGPVEDYRFEKGGPNLFVYSRLYYYPDSTGYREGRNYFFRKNNNGEMLKMNYKNLMDAMADNPASVQTLKAARSRTELAIATGAISFITCIIGSYATFKGNSSSQNENMSTKINVSPALIVGGLMTLASVTIYLGAHKHVQKAINIYNQ